MSEESKTKVYVLKSGKHIGPNGKKYVKGDKIELTEKEAKGLANKLIDPEALGISTDVTELQAEVERLSAKVEELEQENAELKEAIEEDPE